MRRRVPSRPSAAAAVLVGVVAAGPPLFVPDEGIRLVELPNVAPACPGYGYLRVRGSSMAGARIKDGDIILVRKQAAVDPGAIAVVLIDGELLTLKRVYVEPDGRVRLQPAAEGHEARVYAADRIRVQGRVVKVIRDLE